MVTPFCPSAEWIRAFVRGAECGETHEEACARANRETGTTGKLFGRCQLPTGVLTVPVAGGAGVLKRRDADPILSEHGKWRREHLGAWQAAYGRTAYYIHLMPEIAGIYAGSEGMRLEEFNRRLLETALRWLDFKALAKGDGELLGCLRREREKDLKKGLSIFDLLFRLGREAVFAI